MGSGQVADQSLRKDGRGRAEACCRDEERRMQRDDDAGPRRRAREVKNDAALHVALHGGKKCPC